MNKRLISLLLTVLMVAGMFSCLTVSASAEYDKSNMTAYTMKSGDNVYSVCRMKGIDFYANYDLITAVNGIKNYSAIAPGTVIYLPKPGETYVDDGKGNGSGNGSGNGANVNPGPASQITVPASDFVAYYMIPYKMQSGDTVYNVCRNLGISFNAYSEQIKAINNLKSYSNIPAGTTLMLPSSTAPSNTSGAYKVMGHKILSGETASGIVKSYNMDYNSNVDTLQKLNNKSNLGNIQAGQVLYIAVPASAGGNGNGNGNGNNNPAPSPSPTPANVFAITSAATVNGSFSCQVNGKAVTSAAAGSVVTVVPKANSGCSVKQVSVTKTSNGGSIEVKDNKFNMPNCAVTVTVTFLSGHKINMDVSAGGDAGTLINGVLCFNATKGETVTVTTIANKDYVAKSVNVYLTGTKSQIPVNNGVFTMPDAEVTVAVAFAKGSSYWIKHETNGGSDFNTLVNGIPTDMAGKGAIVTVEPLAGSGLTVEGISYWRNDNKQTYKLPGKNSFEMPGCDVFLSVTFASKNSHVATLDVAGDYGTAKLSADRAVEGTKVTVTAAPKSGYRVKSVTVTPDGGTAKDVTEDMFFTMPDENVTVKVEFETIPTYAVSLDFDPAQADVVTKVGNEKVTKAGVGEMVEIVIEPKPGYTVETISVVDGADKPIKGYTGNTTTFIMPDFDVKVKVTLGAGELAVDTIYAEGGSFYASQGGKKITGAEAGSTVDVVITPDEGYAVSESFITYYEGSLEKKDAFSGSFTMPAKDVVVHVVFSSKEYALTVDSSASAYLDSSKVLVNDRVCSDLTKIPAGATVTIPLGSVSAGKVFDIIVTGNGNTVASARNAGVTFLMPAYDVSATAANEATRTITWSVIGTLPAATDFDNSKFNINGTVGLPAGGEVTPGAWVVVEPKYYKTGYFYELIIKANGKTYKFTDQAASFEMPDGNVTITIEYKQ